MSRNKRRFAWALAAALLPIAGIGIAGPELVEFPRGYQRDFVRYLEVDRPDRSPPQVRYMYVNRAAHDAARAGQPLPSGTVLVMEDRRVQMGADGQPTRDANGRFTATDQVLAVFVQERRAGWGAQYPANLRNAEWEYAVFAPDGARRDVATTGCLTCHLNRRNSDYNFTFSRYLADRAAR